MTMENNNTVVDPALLSSLPATIFLFSVCPYVSPHDILALRSCCSKTLKFLHNEPESEEFWKLLLIRDFGFEKKNNNDWWKRTLQVISSPSSESSSSSIFGAELSQTLIEVATPFESWKSWKRASARFYGSPPNNSNNNKNPERLIHGPYFQRSATIWKKLLDWCDRNPSVGRSIRNTLRHHRGKTFSDWGSHYGNRPGLKACQAVYAFSGGQQHLRVRFDGMMGGYQAYEYYSNTFLLPPDLSALQRATTSISDLPIAYCALSGRHGMSKIFAVNLDTGELFLSAQGHRQRAVRIRDEPKGDEILLWLEEHVRRLTVGEIGVGVMGCHPDEPAAITLYPRLIRPIISSPPPSSAATNNIPIVSHSVTRGVEVVASAVYVPQAVHQLGYIYSLRIRLLTPEVGNSDYYSSPTERGFETCQLRSRHWKITNSVTGDVNNVHGEGVIGMFPLLYEGGYTESGEFCDGATFQYQSCTGMLQRGSFSGSLEFVPGSIQSPTGPPFNVDIKPFLLDDQPTYLY